MITARCWVISIPIPSMLPVQRRPAASLLWEAWACSVSIFVLGNHCHSHSVCRLTRFSGKQLIRRLLDAGKAVTLYDEIVYPDEVDHIRKAHPHGTLIVTQGRAGHLATDLPKALTRDVVGIVNVAGVSRVAECAADTSRCRRLNVDHVQELVTLSAARVRWFIEASTTEVVLQQGDGRINDLAQTKLDAEEWLINFVNNKPSANVHAAALRFATIFGSVNDHPDRLGLSVVRNALSHRTIQMVAGHQTVDLLHVTDAVNAIVLAMNHLAAKSGPSSMEVFTVAPNRPTTVRELIEKAMALGRSKSPVMTIPRDGMYPEVAPAETGTRVPGWEPQVTVDEGLLRLATSLTEETVAFLHRKQVNACSKPRDYTLSEVAGSLQGCTGSLAMDNNGYVAFAHIKEGQEKDGQWPEPESVWRETDMPTEWTFEIRHSGPDIELSLHGSTRKRKNNTRITFEGHTFRINDIDPKTGNLDLSLSTGAPYVPKKFDNDWENAPEDTGLSRTQFRLTPWCCPSRIPFGSEPLYEDDPLMSFILDERDEYRIRWGHTRRDEFCKRVEKAHALAEERLNVLRTAQVPIIGTEIPSSLAGDWKARKYDRTCTNLCDHPTICVDTGDCMCVEAACAERPRTLPGPITWRDVLRPDARRYFNLRPSLPAINVTRVPEDIEKQREKDDPDHFDRLQTEWHGCYSADSVAERAAKMISQPFTNDMMVFLPHWEYTLRFPPVVEWAKNAAQKYLPDSFYWGLLQVPFTFDWGRCNTVLHHLTNVREKSRPAEELRLASAWQPMGDLNSPCYYPDQDVVIPPRTCQQDELRAAYGDPAKVKKVAERGTLATFKGSPNGQGTSLRRKVTCARVGDRQQVNSVRGYLPGGRLPKGLAEALSDTHPRPVWDRIPEGKTYLELLGDTRFCPIPFGTAGWTYRLSDVVYSGCIPVLIADQSHMTFWSMLDWSKFSVQVAEHELNRLEMILNQIPLEELQRKQDALLLVREAFLYPSEGHIEDAIKEHGMGKDGDDLRDGWKNGAFFYALHAAHLVQKTRFYAQWPWHRDE